MPARPRLGRETLTGVVALLPPAGDRFWFFLDVVLALGESGGRASPSSEGVRGPALEPVFWGLNSVLRRVLKTAGAMLGKSGDAPRQYCCALESAWMGEECFGGR